jgi:Cu2+-exporting ATPase
VKSADGLERLAEIDTVVFDKTGTLTAGSPTLVDGSGLSSLELARAAALAARSKHPLARALVEHVGSSAHSDLRDIAEVPGQGMEGWIGESRLRIGHRDWVGGAEDAMPSTHTGSELWFRDGSAEPACLRFLDLLRPDAALTLGILKDRGLKIVLLSGDRIRAVEEVAKACNLDDWHGEMRPDAKVAYLNTLAAQGAKVLMVGDGLNDAPALRAAHVSFSPSSAVDISQNAADFVFQGLRLSPIIEALDVARASKSVVLQNFGLAIAYNFVAVPLAMAGFVTPLIAAIAMSSSSITVTLNSLRLNRDRKAGQV